MLKRIGALLDTTKCKGQVIVQKLINLDDSHEFRPLLSEIEHAPVSPLGRITFWLIIGICAITLLWLILGKIDIVITARGMVIPDGEAKILQPLETGVVSKILVREGDLVKKGQVIMEIDPATTAPGLRSMQENLNEISQEISRLDALAHERAFTAGHGNQVSQLQEQIYQTTIEAFQQKQKIKERELSKLDEQIAAAGKERDANKGILMTYRRKANRMQNVIDIIAYDEYEDVLTQIKTYAGNDSRLTARVKELETNKVQAEADLAALIAEFKANNLQELSNKKMEAAKLKAETDELYFKNAKQRLSAPCDGYVDKLYVHTVGGVVQTAQQLAMITPVQTPLMIKASVLNQDIGDIKENMPVSIKIDAYNFQKYGMLSGKVKTISKNSITDEKLGQVYEVFVEPESTTLNIKNKSRQISAGMTVSAEIKTGKRRIIEFFIYPLIKYLDEGMSIK